MYVQIYELRFLLRSTNLYVWLTVIKILVATTAYVIGGKLITICRKRAL